VPGGGECKKRKRKHSEERSKKGRKIGSGGDEYHLLGRIRKTQKKGLMSEVWPARAGRPTLGRQSHSLRTFRIGSGGGES